MFCKNCGKQIPDGSTFCSLCGTKLDGSVPVRAAAPQPAPGTPAAPAAAAIAGIPIRTVIKIVLVIALLAFFLPFVTVSCNSGTSKTTEITETYTGMELMTTFGSKDDALLAKSQDHEAKVNVFVVLAFLCAAAGLGLLFAKQPGIITAALSCAGFLLLLIFRMFFRPYYGLNQSDIKNYIDVDTRFGLLLCMLALLAAAVLCYLEDPAAFPIPDSVKAMIPTPGSLTPAPAAPTAPPAPVTPAAQVPPVPPVPEAPAAETAVDAVTDAVIDSIADKPIDAAADAVIDNAVDTVIDNPADTPIDNPVDTPAPGSDDAPTEE